MNEDPVLTYVIKEEKGSSIKISGYADGSLDLACVQEAEKEEGQVTAEFSLTPKGIAALKRALALWESAVK